MTGSKASPSDRVLLTGATGYVGGRLLNRLQDQGRCIRCMARRPENLAPRVAPDTEVVAGDVFDPASLRAAMEGVQSAYYMIHSMASGGEFEERDLVCPGGVGKFGKA